MNLANIDANFEFEKLHQHAKKIYDSFVQVTKQKYYCTVFVSLCGISHLDDIINEYCHRYSILNMIIDIIYETYKDTLVCINIQRNDWYEFRDHRWYPLKLNELNVTIEKFIPLKVRDILFEQCNSKIKNQQFEHSVQLMHLIKKINNNRIINAHTFVAMCKNKFYDSKFIYKLDSDSNLIGFSNGVYEYDKLCFRNGVPSDYISKTVGYEFKNYDTLPDILSDKINEFFLRNQISDDLRDYLLTFIALVLRGKHHKIKNIWDCDHDKAFYNLVKRMLNDSFDGYFATLPDSFLARKMGMTRNSPEFADKAGKRLLVVENSECNDISRVHILNNCSIGEKIIITPLYGDVVCYKIQFTMIIKCEKPFGMPTNKTISFRNLCVVPFKKPLNQISENNIDNNIDIDLVQAMMWLVLTKYNSKWYEGCAGWGDITIREPEEINQYMFGWKIKSNHAEFFRNTLQKTNNNSDVVEISSLFDTYKQWHIESYSHGPKLSLRKFMTHLINNDYKLFEDKICGVCYCYFDSD